MSDPYQSTTGQTTSGGGAPTRVRYWVVAALCLAAFVAYVQRNSIGAAEEHIRIDLALSKSQMGWVISAFFLTYALLQLPTGYLGQVWGTRRGLTFFATAFSLAAVLFALGGWVGVTLAFWWLIGSRLLMGGSQAGIFPCAVNTISKWMPDARRSVASGMLGSFMSIGGAAGGAVTGLLLGGFVVFGLQFEALSWEWVFAVYCLPGFLFAALFYAWFRDEPDQHAKVNDAEIELIRGFQDQAGKESPANNDGASPHEPTPWRQILTSPSILALCGQQVFRAFGYMFFASWFATYLRETREVDTAEAGILMSLPLLAVVIGSPTGGVVSDWILAKTGNRRLSRQGVAAVAMLACGLLVLASLPVANPLLAVTLISAGSFCAAFGGPCAYTATIDMGGRHIPMVFSTMNMAGNIGAFIFPVLVPLMLNASELYVDKIEIRAGQFTRELETEAAGDSNAEKVERFGEEDAVVLRFHHGTNEKRTLFGTYNVDAPQAGKYDFVVRYAGDSPPPLRLLVNGSVVSENVTGGLSADELSRSTPISLSLNAGDNVVRIETITQASGNWNLVLFTFAGIYLAACICWLLVNTNVTIKSENSPPHQAEA